MAWKFFNPFGQKKQLSVNAALATLPTVENALAADVVIVNANTYYDGPSVSLPPGTWFVVGHVTIDESGTGYDSAKLWDGTTVYASGEDGGGASGASAVAITLQAIITLAAQTTIKISAASSNGGSTAKIKAAIPHNAAGPNGSKITAVQLTPPTALPFYAGAMNYVTLAQFAALVPTDGMTVNVVVDAAAGVIWTFRYNAGSASAYKWEFIGGSEMSSEVSTVETWGAGVTGGVWAALTTPLSIVVPRAGEYAVTIGATIEANFGAGNRVDRMSYDIGATPSITGDAVELGNPSGGNISAIIGSVESTRKKTLTAVTLTSKFWKEATADYLIASKRIMRIKPVRIS